MATTKIDASQIRVDALDSNYIKLALAGGGQVLPPGDTLTSPQTIVWESTVFKSPNTNAFHNIAGANPARIFPPVAGLWVFTTQVRFFGEFPSGPKTVQISLNGAKKGEVFIETPGVENDPRVQAAAMVNITTPGTDYITVATGQSSGNPIPLGSGETDTWIYGYLVRQVATSIASDVEFGGGAVTARATTPNARGARRAAAQATRTATATSSGTATVL